MAATFTDKLQRLTPYEAGMGVDDARSRFAIDDVVKLASNESPTPAHPDVIEAVRRAAAEGLNRYPEAGATTLRKRIAERFELEPGDVTVGNGSCDLLLAAAEALLEPGTEVVYAWPSFSMYPYLPGLSGATEVRVPLDETWRHDLDAMAAAVGLDTRLVVVCNPNNPTGTYIQTPEIDAFVSALPDHVTVVLDEAYVEFQALEDPDASIDLLKKHANLVVLRTFSKCYGLAGLRIGYALGSATLRSALDAVRQPFSVNHLAAVAGAEALRHGDDVIARVERNLVERMTVEEALDDLEIDRASSQANFSWFSVGSRDEAEVFQGLAERGIIVRGGTGLGAEGHLRVTYGTRAENERFIEALSALWR
ncbi:MAG: histidinol-phosphate transaminase [Solirubrobacterales bacterium]